LLDYTVTKACTTPKKINLVHQTVSPRERVGSGNETNSSVENTFAHGRTIFTHVMTLTNPQDKALLLYYTWTLDLGSPSDLQLVCWAACLVCHSL